MPTTYRNADWVFDRERWANDLQRQPDSDLVAAQELSGLTGHAWWNWLHPERRGQWEQKAFKRTLAGGQENAPGKCARSRFSRDKCSCCSPVKR